MGIIDLIIIALIALLGLFGFFRGFVKQLFSLGAWLISLLLAFFLTKPLMPQIALLFNITQSFSTSAITFIGIFVISFIIIKIIAHLLAKGIQKGALGFVDRLLGLTWGAAKALLIVSLLFLAADFLKTLPLVGPSISNFLDTDLKLTTEAIGIGRYLYENNFATLLINFAASQFSA